MVVIKHFTTSQFLLEPSLEGRLLFDTTLKSFRYNNSINYNNIIVNKDNENNVSNINNFSLDGNLNIINHDRVAGTGLTLNGTLVTSTAAQLNYTNTTQGIAEASKSLILDLSRDISNINVLSASSLVTNSLTTDTFNTTGNVGINTSALDFALEVNSSNGECLKLSYNDSDGNANNYVNLLVTLSGDLLITPSGNDVDITTHNGSTTGLKLGGNLITATATKLNYTDTTPGIVEASKAMIVDNNRDLSNVNNLSITGNFIAVGNSSITGMLDVTAATILSDTLTVNNIVNFNDITDATSYISGGCLTVDGGAAIAKKLYVGTDFNVGGNSTMVGTLGVTDAVTMLSTLGVTGATTMASTLGVTGATTLSSTLDVTNVVNLNDITDATSATSGGCLTIDGGAAIAKKLYVGTDFNIGGNAIINGSLDVVGSVVLSSDLSTIGNLIVGGPILSIPTGNTAARPATPLVGYVRYNTETSQFEGFGAGDSWGSLGGVSDVDQNTKILAENFAGSNDNNLRFFNDGVETMRLNNLGKLGIGTNAPDKQVEINSTTGDCLRLSYNDSNGSSTYHCDFTLNQSGSLTVSPTGPNPNVSFVSNISASSFAASKQNVNNNTVDFPMSLTILPDTASANGLGTGIEFNSLNDAYTIFTLGTLEYYSTDVSDGSENGACRFRLANNGSFNIAATLTSDGYFSCTNVTETSDVRVKENIQDIDINESLTKIINLESKTYNFINDSEKKSHIGFIAQEVKEIIPEVVNISKTEVFDDFHSINYTGLIPHLVNCIKNLNNEIIELKKIVKDLQK